MKKKLTMVLGICLCSLFVFIGCGDSSSSTTSSSSSSSSIKVGQSVTLSQDVLMGDSKESLDLGISYMQQKNNNGFNSMMKRGQLFEVSKGTRVNIISLKVGTVELETPSGRRGFTVREAVK